jgi:methyl-accepting chemotaxis protein
MNSVTQQVAANAEESAAAAEELGAQSESLMEMVDEFVLGDQRGPRGPATPAPMSPAGSSRGAVAARGTRHHRPTPVRSSPVIPPRPSGHGKTGNGSDTPSPRRRIDPESFLPFDKSDDGLNSF